LAEVARVGKAGIVISQTVCQDGGGTALNRTEKILAWLLRVGGAVMLVALVAVFMPFEWMDSIHRQTGLGELPHVPIVGYLTRSISAFYALHGALLLFLARDVSRHLPVVRFLAVAGIVFGVLLLGLDWAVEMPALWTLGEGPWVMVLSGVVLWFTRACKRNPPSGKS
jgi:hypothetical protein